MLKGIMTYENYLQLGRQPSPYFYFVKHNGKTLYYLGIHHCFDPSDSINCVIKHYWKDFLEQVQDGTVLVLNEGGLRTLRSTEDESILKDGEAGLITYLASLQKTEIASPEPSFEYENTKLLSEFSKEEIVTFNVIRTTSQWNRLLNKPDFEEYIQKSLEDFAKDANWKDMDFSLSARTSAFEKIIGETFEKTNYKLMTTLDDPTKTHNITNKIARTSSMLRDAYIVDFIIKEWNESKNIFVVYGKTHSIMQEPALKDALCR